ncbi:hypothetical protein BB559_002375 [Furculomyces boomerangus]|uniref:Protein-lysine N-methyltransferase EFM5 n=2 Tax=Harpellales TaxID=61421 RepID=A0A2T9YVY8_9FUNG|nr:hypothetical protein BB559_002375 [Furculomyces boomerangus]PVZ99140.1 hypothetical protein BB558_004831 [Smittium angustum]PWA00448.1 hypothetical protein BB558_003486 [Smittium angustum]
MEDSGKQPALSAESLAALQSFYVEKHQKQVEFDLFAKSTQNNPQDDQEPLDPIEIFTEDWQLSQFWYDDKTCDFYVDLARPHLQTNSLILFISSPTAFLRFKKTFPNYENVALMEIDDRFSVYKDQFIKYDYLKPLNFPNAQTLKGKASFIIMDPPFLNEDCLTKFAITTRFLSNTNTQTLLSTGIVMKSLAKKFGLHETNFEPTHRSGLSNKYRAFANFQNDKLKWI